MPSCTALSLPDPIVSPPDAGEMAHRLGKVRERMAAEGTDALVLHDPDNIFYLTNFANYVHGRPFLLVVPRDGALRFVAPRLEEEHVRVRSVGPVDLVRYLEFPAPAGEAWSDRLQEALGGAPRVGLEAACPL